VLNTYLKIPIQRGESARGSVQHWGGRNDTWDGEDINHCWAHICSPDCANTVQRPGGSEPTGGGGWGGEAERGGEPWPKMNQLVLSEGNREVVSQGSLVTGSPGSIRPEEANRHEVWSKKT